MTKIDKAALFAGIAGTWLFMSNVEPERWGRVALGAAIMVFAVVLEKIGERIQERQEEQEEREQEHRENTFAAWISGGTLKG